LPLALPSPQRRKAAPAAAVGQQKKDPLMTSL